jgi:hypothetical protein
VQSGSLERVARGVYMRPKLSEYTGRVSPNPLTVVEVITKANGETTQIHGAEAARRLGFSTQVQVLPTYYTSDSTRVVRVGSSVVRLKHVSKNRLQHAGSQVGVALTALHYIGKKGLSQSVASKIISVLSSAELNKLLACKMPQWMRLALKQAAEEAGYLSPA